MTDHEAQAFGERLKRIWAPLPLSNSNFERREGHGSNYIALITTDEATEFRIYSRAMDAEEGVERTSCTMINGERVIINAWMGRLTYLHQTQEDVDVIRKWHSFFRRNCWLSGCDIEASAHEKAEWMQGFSREELEAWNLKI